MTAYRSPREYAWAAWLDCLQVPYQYEALQERLSRPLRYQPDFWLPGTEAWLEIKAARPTYADARAAMLAGVRERRALGLVEEAV